MAGPALTPAQARKMVTASNSQLARLQGPELIYSTTFTPTAPQTIILPRALPVTRPMAELWIVLRFRLAVTVANFTAVAPEAPQNFLQNIRLSGTHKDFGNLTPINISGATAFQWPYLYGHRASGQQIVNGVVTGQAPGTPFTSPFLGTTAGSPYDMTLLYRVPVGPYMGIGQANKKQACNFWYQALDWADSLQLQLQIGDASAFGDPTGATTTFSGFGGTGSPTLEVHLNYGLLGAFQNRVNAGVCVRSEQLLPAFTAVALQTLVTTLQKQITTNVLLKTGTTQTAALTAGVDTWSALSDTQTDRTQLQVDNKPIRNNSNNLLAKCSIADQFGATHSQGYFLLSFVDSQNVLTAYRGDGLPGGSQLGLFSDFLTGVGANSRQKFIQEMCYGGPFPPL